MFKLKIRLNTGAVFYVSGLKGGVDYSPHLAYALEASQENIRKLFMLIKKNHLDYEVA